MYKYHKISAKLTVRNYILWNIIHFSVSICKFNSMKYLESNGYAATLRNTSLMLTPIWWQSLLSWERQARANSHCPRSKLLLKLLYNIAIVSSPSLFMEEGCDREDCDIEAMLPNEWLSIAHVYYSRRLRVI